MYYVLIKGKRDDADLEELLSFSRFIEKNKIKKLEKWHFTNQEVNFNNYIYRKSDAYTPIWHYINYAKGCRSCEVWKLDGIIKDDKTLIQYLKSDYCGVIFESDLSHLESFVRLRIGFNAVTKISKLTKKSLHHIDSNELAKLNDFIKDRVDDLNNNISSTAITFLRREFSE
jgi:hypothetical protein